MSKLAIVGVSCILPGATSPQEFFNNLLAGTDSRAEGGATEFGIDPDELGSWGDDRHRVASRRGGFAPPVEFDPEGYRLPAEYLAGLDRSFHWALHVAREALTDSGLQLGALPAESTGLILGNYSFPTRSSGEIALPLWRAGVTEGLRRAGVLSTGNPVPPPPAAEPDNLSAFGFPARVVCEALGLQGPQFALDAACSSALYSIKLAGDYLNTGRADLMLAGAVCAPDPALIHLSFSDLDAFPGNGVSQPFDRRSTGIVTGQGAGMFVVKRLADAVAHNDRIYAIVDGVGLSNDGAGRHLLSPNLEGQLRAYDLAYQAAGVNPHSVDYIECHATGTPLGDTTEVQGLHRFFGAAETRPSIGSVKANIGHLLTVAGFSSVLKLIMSIHEGVLPHTPGVDGAIDQLGEFDIIDANRPWQATDGQPRRAAVSAFGFGGTNAHLVLSSPDDQAHPPPTPRRSVGPALIVGMGCHVGPITDLATFERHVFTGLSARIPVPPRRWYGLGEAAGLDEAEVPAGAYCADLAVDPLAYRIPPSQLTDFNSQHLLMLSVADEALTDAGYAVPSKGDAPRRVAVVIAMEMEPHAHGHRARLDIGRHVREECARTNTALSEPDMARVEAAVRDGVHAPIDTGQVTSYIGNIMASRISARYDFTGPSFTVAADGAGSAAALDVARLLLTDLSIDAVLVGAVDLTGGVVATAARRDRNGEHHPVGEGAAAIVLIRGDEAPERAYARLDAINLSYPYGGTGVDEDAVTQAATKALAEAGHAPQAIGLVEVAALSGREAELRGLASAWSVGESNVFVTSLRPLLGDTQNLSGLLGVMKTALAVYLGTIPPATVRGGNDCLLLTDDDPPNFRAAHEARPWMRSRRGSPRVASVSMIGARGSHANAIVTSHDDARPAVSPTEVRWPASGCLIAPISASDGPALLAKLATAASDLDDGTPANVVVSRLIEEHRRESITMVIVGTDAQRFASDLHAAIRDLPAALDANQDWLSPHGSFCTPHPVGTGNAKVALVYPGAFSTYPGAANDLFRLVPGLLTMFEESTDAPAEKFQIDHLYPRGRSAPSRRELMQSEATLLDDIPSMLVAGTNIATLHTEFIRSALRVPVHGAFGYSLGESSMLYALGVWDPANRDDDALRQSALFRDLLRGRKEVVRRAWNIHDSVPDRKIWTSLIVLGDVEKVIEATANLAQVFITHINSPVECVIAGSPPDCAAIVTELGMQSARTPTSHVMHCELVRPHFDDLAALNLHPTHNTEDLSLFSAYDYSPILDVNGSALSHRIAETLCTTTDFPRLVRTAYHDGFRVFIDVGPSATCTRWIDQTLSTEPHVAVAFDRRGMSTADGLCRALAMLISHGVDVDLSALQPSRDTPSPGRTVTVPTGGESIVERVERLVTAALRGPSTHDPSKHTDTVRLSAPDLVAAVDLGYHPRGLAFHGIPFVSETVATSNNHGAAPSQPPSTMRTPATPISPFGCPADGDARSLVASNVRLTTTSLKQAVVGDLRRTLLAAHAAVVQTETAIARHRVNALVSSVAGGFLPAPRPTEPNGRRASVQPQAFGRTGPSTEDKPRNKPPIWDRADLIEFATGSIGSVFGSRFAAVDEMAHRVRLPAPPYLFVDRVIELNAEVGSFERSTISTEFDIPRDAWFTIDGLAPPAITIEAGQCDMLLISYLGIDLRNTGNRFYRLLDSTLVFHGDLPQAGQTLRYDIVIDQFVWNGDMLLFFFNYLCYADGKLILELENASAGFFTQEELDLSRGAITAVQPETLPRKSFKPLAYSAITQLSGADLAALAEGRRAEVFGDGHWQPSGVNQSLRLPGDRLRFIDEITDIDRIGGSRGLGQLSAVTYLEPDGWYFACHFIDDPVLAGSMIAEGAVQILQTYAIYLGMHLCLPDAQFQSVIGLRTDVKVRGQVTPVTPNIRYVVDIDELTLVPRPTVIANITVYDGDKAIVSMRNFGVQIREKPGTPFRAGPGGVPEFLGRTVAGRRPALINEMHLAHAATGDLGVAMGPEFDVYQDHPAPYIPNGDFQFVDRIVNLVGTRGDIKGGETMITEYDAPAEAWYFTEAAAATMPNCVVMETSLQAAILLGYYLGATLQKPSMSYRIRNLDGRARFLRDVDLRGRTIEHRTTLLDSTEVPGSVLQRFQYELWADGEAFYAGESLFGYFTAEALENQLGLDGGQPVAPWIAGDGRADRALHVTAEEYHALLLIPTSTDTPEHMKLLDGTRIVVGGGNHGRGYVHGVRRITSDDWYFTCHFHRDPVMPGSLGVEAIIHVIQLFVLKTGAASHLSMPVFHCPTDEQMSWKYRGQLLREDSDMAVEAHISDVRVSDDRVVVTADAWLWNGDLRIYEITNVSVEVRSGETHERIS